MSVLIATSASQNVQTAQFTKDKKFTKSTRIYAPNALAILISRNA